MESHNTELLRTNSPSLGKRHTRGISESAEERAVQHVSSSPFVTAYGNLSWEAKIEIRPFLGSREKTGRVSMLVPKTQLRLQRN